MYIRKIKVKSEYVTKKYDTFSHVPRDIKLIVLKNKNKNKNKNLPPHQGGALALSTLGSFTW